MVLIDFHCHLDYNLFDKDRNKVIEKINKSNIIAFSNTLSFKDYIKAKALFKNQKNIKVCPGLYPQEAEKISNKEFKKYLNYIEKDKNNFLVIGEVGLDFHHTKDENLKQIQIEKFKSIIELAIKLNKPLCIHTRKAEEKVIQIIEYYINKTGFKKFNLHCFMGNKKLIPKIKQLGIFCSIPMILLNSKSFQNLVKELPIKQILVETDSPFLNPNKQKNTPLNIPIIYNEIAKIKGLNKNEIEHIIFKNYQNLVYL